MIVALAISRIARVPRQITFLIISIDTTTGINIGGVPWETKCANIWIVLLNHPKIINLSQRKRARERIKVRCPELLTIYGNNPNKLLIKINQNREKNVNVLPLDFRLKFWILDVIL